VPHSAKISHFFAKSGKKCEKTAKKNVKNHFKINHREGRQALSWERSKLIFPTQICRYPMNNL